MHGKERMRVAPTPRALRAPCARTVRPSLTNLVDGLDAVPLLGLRAERVRQQTGAWHGWRGAGRGHELVARSRDHRRLAGSLELLIRLQSVSLARLCHLLEVLDASVRIRRLATANLHLSKRVEALRVARIRKLFLPSSALQLRCTAVAA